MPFAVIQTGGKQHRVEPGQTIEVEKLPIEEGQTVDLTEVLLVSDDAGLQHGRPLVEGARVVGRVLKQARGRKIIVFKYKPKVRYRKKTGHRQSLTRIAIEEIVTASSKPPKAEEPALAGGPSAAEEVAPKRARRNATEGAVPRRKTRTLKEE